MVKVQNPGIEIPGYGRQEAGGRRQDFKRIQRLPVPEFKLWLCKMGEELFNQGAALMKKDGREERFAEMCLELYDTVEKGFVTPAELRQCLFEEAGVRFRHPSDSLLSERKEATKV